MSSTQEFAKEIENQTGEINILQKTKDKTYTNPGHYNIWLNYNRLPLLLSFELLWWKGVSSNLSKQKVYILINYQC